MRISSGALRDFNRLNKQNFTAQQLRDEPGKSIEVAGWLIERIVWAYKDGPVSNMEMSWLSRPYVGLVTLGYIAGYAGPPTSPRGRGVAYVVKKMVLAGIKASEWTPQYIIETAKGLGLGNRGIGRMTTLAQVDTVLADYFAQSETRDAARYASGVRVPPVHPSLQHAPPSVLAPSVPVARASIAPGGGGFILALIGIPLVIGLASKKRNSR